MKTATCVVLCLLFSNTQAAWRDYQHLSPRPQSTLNTRESTIIIRQGSPIDPASLSDGLIRVSGDQTGPMSGRFFLSSDRRTLLFKPSRSFDPGETVSVSLAAGIRARDGAILPDCEFSFQTAPSAGFNYSPEGIQNPGFPAMRTPVAVPDSRPAVIPKITTVIYD